MSASVAKIRPKVVALIHRLRENYVRIISWYLFRAFNFGSVTTPYQLPDLVLAGLSALTKYL